MVKLERCANGAKAVALFSRYAPMMPPPRRNHDEGGLSKAQAVSIEKASYPNRHREGQQFSL